MQSAACICMASPTYGGLFRSALHVLAFCINVYTLERMWYVCRNGWHVRRLHWTFCLAAARKVQLTCPHTRYAMCNGPFHSIGSAARLGFILLVLKMHRAWMASAGKLRKNVDYSKSDGHWHFEMSKSHNADCQNASVCELHCLGVDTNWELTKAKDEWAQRVEKKNKIEN